jgi:hypothetical protein
VLVYGITASDLNDSRHEPHGAEVLLTQSDVADWCRTRPEAADYATRHYWQGRLAEVSATYRHRHGVKMWAAKAADGVWPGCCPEAVAEADRQLQSADWLAQARGYAPTRWFAHRQYDHMKQAGWEQPPFDYLKNYRTEKGAIAQVGCVLTVGAGAEKRRRCAPPAVGRNQRPARSDRTNRLDRRLNRARVTA